MHGDIPLTKTLNVLAGCVMAAEEDTRERIHTSFPRACEDELTTVFQMALHDVFDRSDTTRALSSAFAFDLQQTRFVNVDYHTATAAATGLTATASWHDRQTEKKTGGDFGFVLIRPSAHLKDFGSEIRISTGHGSGILVQAKKKPFGKNWGTFTPQQKQILPPRLEYLWLCLYRLADRENRDLAPFEWTDCKGSSLIDVGGWLKADTFPRKFSSAQVVRSLGEGRIGTSDPEIISGVIAPEGCRTLVIRLDWPNGKPPRPAVSVNRQQQQQQLRH